MPNQDNSNTTTPSDQPVTPPVASPPPFSATEDVPPPPPTEGPALPTATEEAPPTGAGAAPTADLGTTPDLPPVITTPGDRSSGLGGKRTVATLLGIFLLIGGLAAGIILVRQQQLFKQQAAIQPTSEWHQCTGGGDPGPCSSCSVSGTDPARTDFSCEVRCPNGDPNQCPPSPPDPISVHHGYDVCREARDAPCLTTDPDWIRGGSMQGPQPFEINRQELNSYIGTFPDPGCGRVQIDVAVNGISNPAGGIWVSENGNCQPSTTPTPPPQPTPTPGVTSSPTPTPGITSSPTPTPGVTSSPTPVPTPGVAQCLDIRAYKVTNDTPGNWQNWTQLTSSQLATLKSGDVIYFTVPGTSTYNLPNKGFDKAQFAINGQTLTEITTLKPQDPRLQDPLVEFYQRYQIPAGTSKFTIQARIHHTVLGWIGIIPGPTGPTE